MTLPIIYAGGVTSSGTGSPVGVVVPQFIGQVYEDTTPGPSWFATGLTDTDWFELSSSGGIPIATLSLVIDGSLLGNATAGVVPFPFDPVNLLPQGWNGPGSPAVTTTLTFPQSEYAPGLTILTTLAAQIMNIDTTVDQFDISLTVLIQSMDGTSNAIGLTGSSAAVAGGAGDSASFDSTGLSLTVGAGTDLVYDSGTGTVTTTAGGTYSMFAVLTGNWD